MTFNGEIFRCSRDRLTMEFYSLPQALQDMYICLKMEEALANPNQEIETRTQIWAQ